ncbi:ATP-binding protein [Mycobacterium sp. WMMD1722]|uniref:ATP-binding protein n=1 Tax=Mycobacterium sp. WMMD1722 TaxID=3404117 RepID=UPI003BF584D9
MIDSASAAHPAHTALTEPFARVGVAADGEAAARLREEFARWLQANFDLDPIRSSDLLLATNEALANAAEFAYWNSSEAGTMDLHAQFESAEGTLTVTIVDRGSWRERTPELDDKARGRGIPLMEALTDRSAIDRTSEGTRVRLQWTGITGAAAAEPA